MKPIDHYDDKAKEYLNTMEALPDEDRQELLYQQEQFKAEGDSPTKMEPTDGQPSDLGNCSEN